MHQHEGDLGLPWIQARDQATSDETRRHNQEMESHNQATLDEIRRHNQEMESHNLVHRLHDHDIGPSEPIFQHLVNDQP